MGPGYRRRGFVQSLRVVRERVPDPAPFPFTLLLFADLETVDFDGRVTFILGENGTGKSTLVEAVAVAFGLNPEGGSRNFRFSTPASHSPLHDYVRLAKSLFRPKDAYFLRAESYFNVATEIEELDKEPSGGPPIIGAYGGRSLHEQSHGESFLALLIHRLGPNGFYVFDEPEAGLSPTRQMSMLYRLRQLVDQGSQFIIATHSPILITLPGALIYLITEGRMREVTHEETEVFRLYRSFLGNPERMLAELFQDDGTDPDD